MNEFTRYGTDGQTALSTYSMTSPSKWVCMVVVMISMVIMMCILYLLLRYTEPDVVWSVKEIPVHGTVVSIKTWGECIAGEIAHLHRVKSNTVSRIKQWICWGNKTSVSSTNATTNKTDAKSGPGLVQGRPTLDRRNSKRRAVLTFRSKAGMNVDDDTPGCSFGFYNIGYTHSVDTTGNTSGNKMAF